MATPSSAPVPVLDDVPLLMVQRLENVVDAGFTPIAVLGLDGEVHQRTNRRSHVIRIHGVLCGPDQDQVRTDVELLQTKASSGAEMTFTADVITALDLQNVVVRSLRLIERAGAASAYDYELELAESPPLPPPAQVSAFGGLDGFGLGDLGFDTDLLDELSDLAGDVAGAVDAALDAVDALGALSNLGDLSFDGILEPLGNIGSELSNAGSQLAGAASALTEVFGS